MVGASSSVQHATLKGLGVRWWYWLIVLGFAAAGVGSFASIRVEPESKWIFIGCGLFFCLISLLGLLWPVLRIREKQGAVFSTSRHTNAPMGVFIPMSQAKVQVMFVGGVIFGVFGLLGSFFADSPEHRIKAFIVLGCVVAAGVSWFISLAQQKRSGGKWGILLSEKGILWQEPLLSPCFIPWPSISSFQTYNHPENYGRFTPSIGVLIDDTHSVGLKSSAIRKLSENQSRFGWHLYLHAESLLVPAATVAAATNFYLQNPHARTELGSGAALERINSFAAIMQ